MVTLFKHNTKKTEAVPEPIVAPAAPEPVQVEPPEPVVEPPAPAVANSTFWSSASADGGLIRVEEKWQDGALVVRADLPGIDPDRDIRLTVVNGRLVIEAERREEAKVERDGYVIEEQRYGMFARALPLRDGVDASAITGTYNDGVLEVRIPMPANLSTNPAVRIPITT